MPLVSVIMPVYNGAKYIDEAIESILSQTFSDFEFIIIDDGSTDDTIQHIKRFNDHRMLLLKNEHNMGITQSLNRGLESAKGEYICRMDADDISLANRLEKQVSFLQKYSSIVLVGSSADQIDDKGIIVGEELMPLSPAEINRIKFIHNPFIHGSVMFRKSLLVEFGGYDVRWKYNEDYDLWLRFTSRYLAMNMSDKLLRRRIHQSNITVLKEVELVKYRLQTLFHAILYYYKNPLLMLYIVRPMIAYFYKVLLKRV